MLSLLQFPTGLSSLVALNWLIDCDATPAICCAVQIGYSFLNRFSSLFDQTGGRLGFFSPNVHALLVAVLADRPSFSAMYLLM